MIVLKGMQLLGMEPHREPAEVKANEVQHPRQAWPLPSVGGLNQMRAAGMAGATSSRLALCLALLLIAQCVLGVSARTYPAGRVLQQVSSVTQPLVGGCPALLAQMSVMGMPADRHGCTTEIVFGSA